MKNDESFIPYYAIHRTGLISGFFGDFRYLSNFYILNSGVWFENLCYPSVEHAYQAAKYPTEQRNKFLNITASESKKLGKISPNFNSKKWNKKKFDIMRSLVYQKFQNNNDLKEKLLLTDGYILEERNAWGDKFWGVTENGEGENNLGKILMSLRDIFRHNPDEYF